LSKKKIFVMIDWFLPGTKAGGPVRSVYSLTSVLKSYFDFYIITTNTDLGSNVAYSEIKANTLFKKDEVNYFYFDKDAINPNALQKLINSTRPDLIYLNSFWSFNFSIAVVRLKHKNLISSPLLLAPRGMLGKGALGLKAGKKKAFIAVAKALGWYKGVIFHATQTHEESDIRSKFSRNKILIAPNINSGALIKNRAAKEKGSLRLFYLSRIARVKNLHFALEALANVPDYLQIEYDIYGNLEDYEYWKVCQQIIKTLPKNITVNYRSELSFPEVQNVIGNYHCLYLPTLNENYGHAIVESLLCGCPAIISDQTPWTDIEEQGAGFSLALNNKQAFTDAIVYYAHLNQPEFDATSANANNYISKKIDLKKIISQYENLFNDCIKN